MKTFELPAPPGRYRVVPVNRPFTITVYHVAGYDPAKVSNDMAQRNPRASADSNENVLSFALPSPESGRTALNLVYQAAKVFSSMEDHARETEARAQSLCRSAAERLKLAEERAETVERERREMIDEVDFMLQDASRALSQAQSRCAAAEHRLTAMEFRAQAAEAEAHKVRETLALVEEAIRKRLLCAAPEAAAGRTR